jgi:hypothetical protein
VPSGLFEHCNVLGDEELHQTKVKPIHYKATEMSLDQSELTKRTDRIPIDASGAGGGQDGAGHRRDLTAAVVQQPREARDTHRARHAPRPHRRTPARCIPSPWTRRGEGKTWA